VKLPRQVTVGPHRFKVTLVPDGILEGAGADGTCVPRHLTIALDANQPRSQKADTLCHELTHALLATVKLDDDVEEAICLAFGPALLALVRDNPDLMEWLKEPQ
jgi:hypothetical protein